MTEWVYNERPDGVRFLTDRIPDPGRGEIEAAIWSWVVRGEDDPREFVDYFDVEESRHGATDEDLAAAYARALDARRIQQREWGPVRSNLNLAFAELNEIGVLARENFACCGNCASAEIHDERDDSRHWHGYIWYHQQDAEHLLESPHGTVYLGYGAYPPPGFAEADYDAMPEDEQEAWYQAQIERMLDDLVFPVFRKHGMRIEWNRNQAKRILVTGANWYAPLSGV